MRSNSADNYIDLFGGEHAASALRKSGHGSAGDSIRRGVLYGRVIRNRQVHGIGKRDGSSSLSIRSMTARTILLIQNVKI
jgi:hypothetical protein